MSESGVGTGAPRAVRTAVIGAGGFGRHHVRIHHGMAGSDLVAVVDRDPAIRQGVTDTYGVPVYEDVSQLPDDLEAVSIAVPTQLHHQIAMPFLQRGISTLIEKPMVRSLEEGRDLIAAAEASGAVIAVGHVERFNPAVRALQKHHITPRFIEAARVAPFSFRSADVGVVLDLMIHDIDIVLHLAGAKPVSVEAVGVPVLTPHEDIANARVTFENGCVATLTASRVATKVERKIRVFSPEAYLVADFGERHGLLYRKSPDLTVEKVLQMRQGAKSLADLQGAVFGDLLTMEQLAIEDGDALTDEIEHFLQCVRDRARPEVSGHEGLEAVSLALRVLEAIRTSPAAG
jgi:predicted dehydrogenase